MIKDIISVLLTRLVARGGNLIVLALLARFLSMEDMAVYGLTTITSYTVIYLGSFGLRNSSAFFVAKGLIPESDIKKALIYAWPLLSVLAVPAMFLVAYFNFKSDVQLSVLMVASAVVAPMLFVYMSQGLFLANRDIRLFNQSELVSRFFLLVGTLVFVVAGYINLFTALLMYLLSHVFSAIYIFVLKYKVADIFRNQSWRHFRSLGSMVRQGGLFSLTMSLVLLNPAINIYASNLTVSAEAAALFFAALKITDLVSEAATSAGLVTYSHGIRQLSRRKSLYQNLKAAWILFMIVLAGTLMLVFFSEFALVTIYGEKYRDAAAILTFLGLSLPFLCFTRVVNSGLCAQGMVASGVVIQGCAVIINGVACLFCDGNITYIALSLVVSRVFCFFAYSAVVSKTMKVNYFKVIFPRKRYAVQLVELGQKKFARLQRK